MSVKRRRNKIELPEKTSDIEQGVFWGFCCLLAFSPFFRGLFFAQEQRVALVFAAILFGVVNYLYGKRYGYKFFSNILDYLVLGLPLVYMASTFFAANYALALDEVLKNLLYFLVFFMALRLVQSAGHVGKIFIVIFLTAIAVSMAGLLTATGLIVNIKDGFLQSDGGTIASTFQYKNSLASYLAASIFMGLYLWTTRKKQLVKVALAAGIFVIFVVFFSTQSQGGYLVFGICSLIFWTLAPDSKKLSLITGTLLFSITALLVSKNFLLNVLGKSMGIAWLWFFAGIVVVIAGQWAVLKYINIKKNIELTTRKLIIAIIIIGVLGIALFISTGATHTIIEKLHMHGAMERITMYQDSLKMILEKPVLGWGGGGWSEAYSKFQAYSYTARQTHSYFLQLAIETGLIGLFIAISIWLVIIKRAYIAFKKTMDNNDSRIMTATLICSVLTIISHAVFDFDLSLSALTITLFALGACLVAVSYGFNIAQVGGSEKTVSNSGLKLIAVTTIISIIICCISFSMISSEQSTNSAKVAIQQKNYQAALDDINSAISQNPVVPSNYIMAGQLQAAMGKRSLAVESAEKAVIYARYNPDMYLELSIAYIQAGQSDKALTAAKKAVELAPLRIKYYELLSNQLVNHMIEGMKNRKVEAARSDINQILTLPDEIDKVLSGIQPDKKALWITDSPLVVTDRIKLSMGIANYFDGNFNDANKLINDAARNPQIQNEAVVWQALAAYRLGDNARAQVLLQQGAKTIPDIQKRYDTLMSLKYIVK